MAEALVVAGADFLAMLREHPKFAWDWAVRLLAEKMARQSGVPRARWKEFAPEARALLDSECSHSRVAGE